MKITILASTYFAALVSANGFWTRQTSSNGVGAQALWEPGSFGSTPTSEDEQLFTAAGRQPNDTSSATFNFAPSNLSDSDSSWTWRVNISEVAVPDSSDGLQVVNTQWDLQWPGAGSLQSFVARAGLNGSEGGGLCLTVAEFDLLPNVTSRYSESDQGNCSAVLGDQCAEKLRAVYLNGDCDKPPAALPQTFEECMDVVSAADGHSHADPGTLIDGNFNQTIQSGDTVWYHTSSAVSQDNISAPYAEAESRLSILLLREISGTGEGSAAATMLCQVVNPSASSGVRSGSVALSAWGLTGLLVAWMLVLA